MVKVKICGIRTLEEVKFLNELKPDYVGFVFAKSKREISIETAEILSKVLDPSIKTVGVFVNADIEFVNMAVEKVGLHVAQLHGEEDQAYADKIKSPEIWKALGVSDESFKTKLDSFKVDGILLDSAVKGMKGGSGISFDWNLASELSKERRIILAGGLKPENVAEAIAIVKPYAVDVSSSVEDEKGKNYEMCKKFIEEVRN